MPVYTYTRNQSRFDMRTKVKVRKNPSGGFIELAIGDSMDLTADEVKYLRDKIVLTPGTAQAFEVPVDPFKGEKGDKGDKGDAGTAGTAGAPGLAAVGNPQSFTPVTFDTWARNNAVGKMLFASVCVGMIALPGQNGHIYFDIAPHSGGSPGAPDLANLKVIDTLTHRNNNDSKDGGKAGELGIGKCFQGFIPNGWWYRFRTFTPSGGWAAPTYAFDVGRGLPGPTPPTQPAATFNPIG